MDIYQELYTIYDFLIFFFPFFFLLDCVVDSDNELFILYFHHWWRRRLTSSFWHHCGTLNISSSSQIISKSTLVKKKKKKSGSRAQFLRRSLSHANRNVATTGKRCRPRQRQAPPAARVWKMNIKKKNQHTNHDSVQGSKGNQHEKCCFHFVSFSKRRTGCGEDGWMLSFSISIYRWLRCYVMLLQKKKIPLYIYIYKLKIITLMQ